MKDILIGTSGYDYPEWKGVFYPDDLKRKDFLSYYSTQFTALELNNTFYNMPDAQRLLGFYERSDGKLSFSVKANRLLTHEIGHGWQQNADLFRSAVYPLLEKSALCAVLFQFPQSFHYTDENRIYLSKLIAQFEGFPVVIEFRHTDWVKSSVFHGLQERNASLVFCDMPQLKYLPDGKALNTPFIGPLAYIRLHGRNADAWYSALNDDSQNGSNRYTYDYSDEELKEFVPIIQSIILTGKKPVVFFNNHPNGSGAKNARRLGELLKT